MEELCHFFRSQDQDRTLGTAGVIAPLVYSIRQYFDMLSNLKQDQVVVTHKTTVRKFKQSSSVDPEPVSGRVSTLDGTQSVAWL